MDRFANYLDFVFPPALPFAIFKNYLWDNLLISTVTVLLCSVNLKDFKTLEEYSIGSIYKKYLAPHKILKEVQSHTAKAWRHLADCGVPKVEKLSSSSLDPYSFYNYNSFGMYHFQS